MQVQQGLAALLGFDAGPADGMCGPRTPVGNLGVAAGEGSRDNRVPVTRRSRGSCCVRRRRIPGATGVAGNGGARRSRESATEAQVVIAATPIAHATLRPIACVQSAVMRRPGADGRTTPEERGRRPDCRVQAAGPAIDVTPGCFPVVPPRSSRSRLCVAPFAIRSLRATGSGRSRGRGARKAGATLRFPLPYRGSGRAQGRGEESHSKVLVPR